MDRFESDIEHLRDTLGRTLAEAGALQEEVVRTIEQRKAMQLELDVQCSYSWDCLKVTRQRLSLLSKSARID